MENLNEIDERVQQWAIDRNLIEGNTPFKHWGELNEKFDELQEALDSGVKAHIVDAIGDMTVVLSIMARQCGSDLGTCHEVAYREIKDRKGRMIDGIFVKEGDQ